ncbi:PQQ-binding-like beta-propeller repeat protein [Georgenia thermotolerans]|uniref:PQQ-binding-like beta-propeller repeat protein n=2 Tax=Georgenia thermotolerans TaxID=527326 RepID=A0A7J5UUP1_9MICO|nr:PQQ-binding-like beta-propeller repeat protein [Georgenia thermotolerans]
MRDMHGIVRGPDRRGMRGVMVSNGHDVVRTDDDGAFRLPDRGRFVFLTRPAGFTASPWWQPAGPDPLTFDLDLHPQALPFAFVHLSDTHVSVPGGMAVGSQRSEHALYPEGGLAGQLGDFLTALPEVAPDVQAVFLTGDLVDHGLPDEYAALMEVLGASPAPVHTIPGNHDHMNGGHENVLTAHNYLTNTGDPAEYERHLGPRWYSFDVPGLHVVAMDWHTHELGLDDAAQEAWLRADLAQVPEHTPWALLFHDQPGRYVLDAAPRPPVATFSGHWHTSRVVEVDGVLHVNTPPALFAGLDYSPPSWRKVTWDGERFTLDTIALHAPARSEAAGALRKATIAATPRPGTAAVGRSGAGVTAWQTFLAGAGHRQGVSVAGDRLFAGSQIEDAPAGAVQALDARTGEVLWTARTAAAVKVSPAVVGDLVVAAEVTGDVAAYRAETGEPVWRRPSSDPLRRFAWGAPTPAGQSVVVGDQADLRRLDARTGEVLWRRTDLAPHHNLVNHAAPLVVGDLVAIGWWPSPQYPRGLDLATGADRWPAEAAASLADFPEAKRLLVMGTAAFDPATDAVLMPGYAATISVDATSGRLRWIARHEGSFSPAAPLVTDAGVVVTVGGRGLRLLDPEDGGTRWDLPVAPAAPFPLQPYAKTGGTVLAPPLLLEDRLLLPGLDGTVRTVSLEGTELARLDLGVPIAAPLTDAGEHVVGIGVDGGIFALEKGDLS